MVMAALLTVKSTDCVKDARMNLEPTDEQRQIVATVRRFVREEIVPLEASSIPMPASFRWRTSSG